MAVQLPKQLYVSHFLLMMPGLELVETRLLCTHVHLLKPFQNTMTIGVLTHISS